DSLPRSRIDEENAVVGADHGQNVAFGVEREAARLAGGGNRSDEPLPALPVPDLDVSALPFSLEQEPASLGDRPAGGTGGSDPSPVGGKARVEQDAARLEGWTCDPPRIRAIDLGRRSRPISVRGSAREDESAIGR